MNSIENYLGAERLRARKLCVGSRLKGFRNKDLFADWWVQQFKKQEGCCYYCDVPIETIRAAIDAKLIETRKTGFGVRGPQLEIDRVDPNALYSPENCVLACYYCNNDKSYIYPADQYRKFFGAARKKHFEFILAEAQAKGL